MDQFKFIPYQFKVEQQCLMRAKLCSVRTKAKDPKELALALPMLFMLLIQKTSTQLVIG